MADNKWRVTGGMSELNSWNYPNATLKWISFWEAEVDKVKTSSEEVLSKVDSLARVKEILHSENPTQEEKEDALMYLVDRGGWLFPEEVVPFISRGMWLRFFWIPMFGYVNTKAHEELDEEVGKRNIHDEPFADQMWEARRLAIFFESQWKEELAKRIRDYRTKRLYEVSYVDRRPEGS